MKTYNVHIYREMRLYYPGIEAESPEAAAQIAVGKCTSEAAAIEDCEGENLAALVDVEGDAEHEQARLVSFDPAIQHNNAKKMLAALQEIAKTPLWGERIEDEDVRNTLAETGEYDLDDDEYTPSGDTEHDQLRDVVETARSAIAAFGQSGGLASSASDEILAVLEYAIETEEGNWDGPDDEPEWLRQARVLTAKARGQS